MQRCIFDKLSHNGHVFESGEDIYANEGALHTLSTYTCFTAIWQHHHFSLAASIKASVRPACQEEGGIAGDHHQVSVAIVHLLTASMCDEGTVHIVKRCMHLLLLFLGKSCTCSSIACIPGKLKICLQL